ncbi:UDP-galactose transporter [Entophlyctis luteolus]|nr:UDP-galactose transporter [Entophlyctis luteolus]
MTANAGRIEMAVCVVGIYVCFLSWGILQERVTTTPYKDDQTGSARKFKYFVFLNVVQSIIASGVAFVCMYLKGEAVLFPSVPLRNKYIQIAIISVCAAPFGYGREKNCSSSSYTVLTASLKYIDYPTMILGKTGKLVPVMLMNIILYRKSFPWQKYLVVVLITAGMSLFMLANPKDSHKKQNSGAAPVPLLLKLWGIALLSVNLLLDGVTNSTQDEICRTFRHVTGISMMLWMNVFASTIMCVFLACSDPFTHELSGALTFAATHPRVLVDVLLFGVCGAVGQCFIFHTIERFGAMFLVTVTVTRKMGSILVSVFLYGHPLVLWQWVAVGLVFAGIFCESYFGKGHRKGGEKTSHEIRGSDSGTTVVDEKRNEHSQPGIRKRK